MGLSGSKETTTTPTQPSTTGPAPGPAAQAAVAVPPPSSIPPNVRFEIKHIDVDGDGNPDKVQVIMRDGNKTTVHEESIDKVAKVIDDGIRTEQEALQNGAKIVTERVVYPDNAKPAEPKPVMIDELWIKQMQQDQRNFDKATSFGNYFKAGAGLALGHVAVDTIATGLLSMFTGEGGGKRRRAGKRATTQPKNKNAGKKNPAKKAARKA